MATAPTVPPDPAARIVTLPNVITLVRLVCVPVFVWLLADDELLAAAGLLAVLGATDWIDGYIARHFNQESNLGKVIDPVADRILLLVAGVALIVQGSVPLVVGILVLTREVIISVAVLALAAAGARRIDVQWAGKAGTLALMFAFPLFLWADAVHGTAHDVVLFAAWFMAVCGLVLSYYAALAYVPLAREALREGRAEDPGQTPSSTNTAGSVS
jgi:cardiolipin synthase